MTTSSLPIGPALPTGTVTFLFTDIVGSTPLWETYPEQMAAGLQIHNCALRGAIGSHGGIVFKTIGDAFQAAFPTAPQALRAAIDGQRALVSAPWNELGELKVRMGLHTGEAELDSGGDEYAVSHTKNRIGRIHSAAHGGQILLSAETKELVNHHLPEGVTLKDLGEHRLKGMQWLEHLYQACAPGLLEAFPLLETAITTPNNLPLELTSFIGREKEASQVKELLNQHRLVTLTGSGGVGKTRLSLQVARELLDQFPDGVWFVELAPVSDPGLVPQSVASMLGLHVEPNRLILETLGYFLSKRELLLVLDNCEHLLEACAQLADTLLHRAPRLKILASSREALGIAGETALRVPSLALPDMRLLPAFNVLQEYEAVHLFTARARAVLPSFQVTAHNAQAVAQVCQRLDGIPLALELAAARLNILTVEQLASRLDHAFRLLTGGSRTALPRQQTLRAAIDWSYRLLSPPEQVLLHRLAVFAGDSNLEAVEAVCVGDGVEAELILDLLSGLVNKSMVNAESMQGEERRYRLLETVRQYAREKLYDSGDSEKIRNQHLGYYVALSEKAFPHLHGVGRLEWTRRLQFEYDNIREALEWAFHDSTLSLQGLRIAVAITDRYWVVKGLFQEGSRWLYAGLQAAGNSIPSLLKAKVLCCLPFVLRNPEQIDAAYEECVALCREIGPQADRELCLALALRTFFDYDHPPALVAEAVQIARSLGPAGTWELGEALYWYSVVLKRHPQDAYDDQSLAAAEEALRVNQAGDRWNADAYWTIGLLQTQRGQDERLARQSFEKALAYHTESNDLNGMWYSWLFLIWQHRLVGHYSMARDYCKQLFESVDAVTNEYGYAMFVYSVAMLLVNKLNDPLTKLKDIDSLNAARLAGKTSKLLKEYGFGWYGGRFKQEDFRALELLCCRLGEEAYVKAWKEGEALSLAQAVELARDVVSD